MFFDQRGERLLVGGGTGLYSYPLTWDLFDERAVVHIGRGIRRSKEKLLSAGYHKGHVFSTTRDGRFVQIDVETGHAEFSQYYPTLRSAAVSEDGQWVAGWGWGRNAWIARFWHRPSGRVEELRVGRNPRAIFAPGGQAVLVWSHAGGQILELETWEHIVSVETSVLSHAAFSPDGELVATGHTRTGVTLTRCADRRSCRAA